VQNAGCHENSSQLTSELNKCIIEMEDDIMSMVDFTNLLLGVTEGTDLAVPRSGHLSIAD
jgi:hypothetical protein